MNRIAVAVFVCLLAQLDANADPSQKPRKGPAAAAATPAASLKLQDLGVGTDGPARIWIDASESSPADARAIMIAPVDTKTPNGVVSAQEVRLSIDCASGKIGPKSMAFLGPRGDVLASAPASSVNMQVPPAKSSGALVAAATCSPGTKPVVFANSIEQAIKWSRDPKAFADAKRLAEPAPAPVAAASPSPAAATPPVMPGGLVLAAWTGLDGPEVAVDLYADEPSLRAFQGKNQLWWLTVYAVPQTGSANGKSYTYDAMWSLEEVICPAMNPGKKAGYATRLAYYLDANGKVVGFADFRSAALNTVDTGTLAAVVFEQSCSYLGMGFNNVKNAVLTRATSASDAIRMSRRAYKPDTALIARRNACSGIADAAVNNLRSARNGDVGAYVALADLTEAKQRVDRMFDAPTPGDPGNKEGLRASLIAADKIDAEARNAGSPQPILDALNACMRDLPTGRKPAIAKWW